MVKWLNCNFGALIGEKELLGVVDEIKLNMAGVLMLEKLQEIEKVLLDFQDINYFSGYGYLAEGLE